MHPWEKFLIFWLRLQNGGTNEAAKLMTKKISDCRIFIRENHGDHIKLTTQIANSDSSEFQMAIVTISYDATDPIDFTEFDEKNYAH